MDARSLPTFEEVRRNAYAMLGDVEDELRSDWRQGCGPTDKQAMAVREARRHVAAAKAELNVAAHED